jgi:glucose-6-phosphate 1-epimerase
MPDAEVARSSDWQHGGIPVAWPWFGRLGEGDSHIHGYAWKSDFRVVTRSRNAAVLAFETESATLEYEIRLGESLSLELRTKNRSKFPFPVGVAFHPYFRVGERDATVIDGFADDGSVPVTNSVDRSVRFGLPVPRRECIIHDQSRKLAVKIVSEGATGLNLWNPGAEKLCPGVIPGDEWRRFVAVEPFAMGMNRFFVLSADESLRLKMSVSLGL